MQTSATITHHHMNVLALEITASDSWIAILLCGTQMFFYLGTKQVVTVKEHSNTKGLTLNKRSLAGMCSLQVQTY